MNTKKINIMFFLYIFGQGGAERIVLNILNNINNKKYNIILILGIREKNEYLPFLKNKNVTIDYLDVPLGQNDAAINKLAMKINQYNPDILFTEARYTNWLSYHAKRVSKNKKVKLIFREASHRSSAENANFVCKFKTFIHYNFGAQKIICVSNEIKKDLNKKYFIKKSKLCVIHNPIDIKNVINMSKEKIDNKKFLKIDKNVKKVVNVARLVPAKNHKMLLDVFKSIDNKNICLIIIGKGYLEQELKDYCKINKIKNVCFLGFVDNPYKYVKACDLFVLSSNFEGFVNVVSESLAVGTPVVATDCKSGPKEVLGDNEYGMLVPVNDVEKMKDMILELLSNKKLNDFYSKKGLKRVKDFNVEKIVKEYEKVIDDVFYEK